MTTAHLEEQLIVVLSMTITAGKDQFWLDWTAHGQELAEARHAVQPTAT
jgi:hypothetical protein